MVVVSRKRRKFIVVDGDGRSSRCSLRFTGLAGLTTTVRAVLVSSHSFARMPKGCGPHLLPPAFCVFARSHSVQMSPNCYDAPAIIKLCKMICAHSYVAGAGCSNARGAHAQRAVEIAERLFNAGLLSPEAFIVRSALCRSDTPTMSGTISTASAAARCRPTATFFL